MLKRIAVLTLACLAMASLASAQITSNARRTFENKMFTTDGYFQFPSYTAAPVACNSTHMAMPYVNSSTGVFYACNGSAWVFPTMASVALTSGRVPVAGTGGILADDADLTFATDTLTATKIIGSTSITDTGLTAGRVTFAGTAGLLSDDADMTFLTDTLTVAKLVGSTSITDTGLTAGRLTFAGAAGLLSDDSDLTFATDTLTATKVSTPNLLTSGAGVGTAAASTVVEGLDGMHATTFTFAVTGADLVTLADGAHGGGKLVYTFPAGEVYVLGAVLDGVVTNTAGFNATPADTFSFGIGTVVGADDDALTGTEQDIVASQTVDTDSGATLTRAVKVILATPAAFDGTASAVTLYVNFAVAAANNSASNDFGLTGTMRIVWANLGDK